MNAPDLWHETDVMQGDGEIGPGEDPARPRGSSCRSARRPKAVIAKYWGLF